MRKLLSLAALCSALVLASCEKDDNTSQEQDYSRNVPNYDFILNAAQVMPAGASASTATGDIEGVYDRRNRIFSYTLRWYNLAGNILATNGIHIHGTAERGFIAPPAPLGPFTGGIVQTVPVTINSTNNRTGTYTGQLFVDGIVVKESDLLGGKYYVDIHTSATPATQSAGEIRGQILFPVSQ